MAVSAIIGIVIAAVQAYAAYEQGQAQQEVYDYNAKVARQQAESAKQAATLQAEADRERSRRILGRQRALYGVAGVEVDAGSPLLIQADSARQAELNAQTIEWRGAVTAGNFMQESVLDRFMGRASARAGTFGAGTSLLKGAGGAVTTYYGNQKGPITVPSTSVQAY